MTKRVYCTKCHRPKEACYCKSIISKNNKLKIVILQHPSEQSHPLGTANMAHLSLVNSFLYVGEDFSAHEEVTKIIQEEKPILIFKSQTSCDILESSYVKRKKHPGTIIFLDGTWKKAKKILFSSPNLQALPCFHFTPQYKGRYTHRKAPQEHFLSTFESVIHVLNLLESDDYTQCLALLDEVMQYQSDKIKKST